MILPIYTEQDLPVDQLKELGLAKDEKIKLEKHDLELLLSGRRTNLLELSNLRGEGFNIAAISAKLSLREKDGVLDILLHPIYREAVYPAFLTDVEAEKLQKGETPNINKQISEKGKLKEILVEFDPDTREFIITDSEAVIAPDMVNSEYLDYQEQIQYRTGQPVHLQDGSAIQYSGIDKAGVRSNKISLVAAVVTPGDNIKHVLLSELKPLHHLPHDPFESRQFSPGYYEALAQLSGNRVEEQSSLVEEVNVNGGYRRR